MWIKFTTKWASGHGCDDYRYFSGTPDEELLDEIVREEYDRKNDWSEHYRGVDVHSIPSPPIEWLEQEIKDRKLILRGAKIYLEILEKALNEYEASDNNS